MTLISSFSKQDQLQTQQPVTIRLKISKSVPKLYKAMLSYYASEIRKLPLEQRRVTVQALNLPQELEIKLIQYGIKQKLKKATGNYKILLATFQEIRALCSVIEDGQDKPSYVPRLFDTYFKPIIQKVSAGKNDKIKLSDFHSQDESLKEMLGLWYRCKVTNEHDLNSFYQTQITITKIKVTYAIGAQGAIALAQALKENTSLTSLDLASNQIGDEARRALQAIESSHPGLEINF